MSSTPPPFPFNPFAPGFDFLQNLVKTGASSGTGSVPPSSWVAPTLDPEELDKRIAELKTVHYWLDQNTKALAATIQALEVQKMTLSALKNMNLNMADLAKAFQAPLGGNHAGASPNDPPAEPQRTSEQPEAKASAGERSNSPGPARAGKAGRAATGKQASSTQGVDPLQMWSALTQQFQQIAASTLRDLGQAPGHEAAATPSDAKSQAKKNQRPRASRRATAPTRTKG